MSYQGDFVLGAKVVFNFNTASFSDGSPITLGGTPALSCYLDSTTEITAGITLTVDYDSRTGMHHVVIDTSNAAYATATDYDVIITAGTVGGTSVVGRKVGSFSISRYRQTRAAPWLGIIDQGTAQAAASTTLTLQASAAFGDDTLIGATIMAYGSTQGYWQTRTITDFVNSTLVATVDAWTVTPSGTVTYIIFGGPPASATLLPEVNVTEIGGSTTPVTNLTDLVNVWYDVGTHKGAEIVLVDTVTAVTDLTASDVGAIKTKTDFLPSAVAGEAGGVFIAGANAATAVDITGNIVGNITGDLSGSVGSVTGAVGSVTATADANIVSIESNTTLLSQDLTKFFINLFCRAWGETSGFVGGIGTGTIKTPDGLTTRGTITVDADANRTSVTIT